MTETIEPTSVDRTGWPAGPWDGEPDRVDFKTAAGLPGLIVRQARGHLCGYVAVPPGHPLHGKTYGDEDVDALDVHGRITYGDRCHGNVCHVPEPGEPADVWWLGFDAAHSFDSSPRGGFTMSWVEMFGDSPSAGAEDYRTVEYMRAECERLAEQLAAMGSK